MNPAAIITLITMLEPLAIPLVSDMVNLFKAHPTLTPDQAAALMAQVATAVHAADADSIATILADQAAHPKA